MRVCVNLTKPEVDIEDEMAFVESLDFPSSVYIPADATLASNLSQHSISWGYACCYCCMQLSLVCIHELFVVV